MCQPSSGARLVAKFGDAVGFYKIGLELAMRGGLDLARELACNQRRVFLDMKLLDIENTVERATRNIAETGATFLTVHAQDLKTLRAAVAGKAGTHLEILGVTVLTNLDAADLRSRASTLSPADLVARRARLAQQAGCEGVVASGQEAARVRAVVGPHMAIVTRASACRAMPQAIRRASPRRSRRSPLVPTIWWSGGRSRCSRSDRAAELFVQSIEAGLARRTRTALG